ncbi:MAG: hypothetical protein L0323_00745, partial [Planctomycetes bacterium]|nr:hypothetical protein [Planctomycetota bacterium]
MRPSVIVRTLAVGTAFSSPALAQLCAVPCNGTQIVCHHQNGIRRHRGAPPTPLVGPNAAAGNILGDALWRIWGVEDGMTRGSGLATFTSWEIGADNTIAGPGPGGGTGTLTFDIPDLELRPVTLAGFTPGVKEPDMTVAATYAAVVGLITLPTGAFRINVSILTPIVAVPASCPPTTGLPTLSNADVAMLFLLAPFVPGVPFYENLRTTTEVNTISNPSVPPGPVGNSYSGSFDALLGAVTHMPINEELFAEMGFYEPTLEAYRQTTGFGTPTRGSGARELAAGDTLLLRVEDWQAGADAMAGQDRLSAILISDSSAGSPLGQAPPGGGPGFFPGSALLPGSAGFAPLYPTPLLGQLLVPFSATVGQGFNCHVVGDVPCSPTGIPSVYTDMWATTPPILVPPGLTGSVLYAAAFSVNLTTLTIPEGTNVVELVFL